MTTVIKKVSKTLDWAKEMELFNDKELVKYKSQGYLVLYACSVYPRGGGDDQIIVKVFNKVVPENILPKFFSNAKLKGQLFGEICEIIL